eukprot:6193891-Pleurochrysis_carterae.AAC.3
MPLFENGTVLMHEPLSNLTSTVQSTSPSRNKRCRSESPCVSMATLITSNSSSSSSVTRSPNAQASHGITTFNARVHEGSPIPFRRRGPVGASVLKLPAPF